MNIKLRSSPREKDNMSNAYPFSARIIVLNELNLNCNNLCFNQYPSHLIVLNCFKKFIFGAVEKQSDPMVVCAYITFYNFNIKFG